MDRDDTPYRLTAHRAGRCGNKKPRWLLPPRWNPRTTKDSGRVSSKHLGSQIGFHADNCDSNHEKKFVKPIDIFFFVVILDLASVYWVNRRTKCLSIRKSAHGN